MADTMFGIKEVFLAPGSAAFPADATGVFGLGYDGKGSLNIDPYNEIKGDKGRSIVTYLNHKITKKTNQLSLALLKFLIGALKASDVSAKVVTTGLTKATDFTAAGGIFTYENLKSLGLDVELDISEKDIFANVTLEKAFLKATSEAIVTASTTDKVVGALNIPMLDSANLPIGGVTPAFGTMTIAEDRLSTFKINLKNVSTKTGMNKSKSARIAVAIEGVMSGPDVTEIASALSFEVAPDITIAMPVTTPYNLVFKSGGLFKMGSAAIDDDKREATVKLAGEYDLDLVDTSGNGAITFQAKL